jgi:PqqD family protein of HPr-rel-A system
VAPGVSESDWSGPFSVSPDVTWRDAPAEIILFDARTDRYHVLNEQAAQIWRLLADGASVAAAAARLSERFSADPAEIEADVAELARDLAARGLLRPEPPA